MPQCVKCKGFFHPDYSVVVDEATNACKCAFCYVDKDYITIEREDGRGPNEKVTRREAEESYKKYLIRLKEDERIAKLLAKEAENPLKM